MLETQDSTFLQAQKLAKIRTKIILYTVTMSVQDLWFPQQCNAGFQSSRSDSVLLD